MNQDKGRKMLRNVKNYCGLISATLSIDILGMLLRRSLLVLITIFVFFSHAHAFVFERRPRPDPELSYFLYPVAGSIPGLQDFYGRKNPAIQECCLPPGRENKTTQGPDAACVQTQRHEHAKKIQIWL